MDGISISVHDSKDHGLFSAIIWASFEEREKRLRKMPLVRRFGALTLCALLLTILASAFLRGLLAAHAVPAPLPSTIFPDNGSAAFIITTVGSSGTIAYTVTDFSGATTGSGQASVTSGHVALTLPREPEGYYVLHIVDHTGSSSATQSIPFAILTPFTLSADSPFGVGVHFTGCNNPQLAQFIAAMGAAMVRDDASWATIEKTPGQYSFTAFDRYMQVLQQNNVDPLLILDYNNRFYDNNQTPYDTSGLTAFANYARAVVAHYGPQLKAVEVYNEYNGLLSTGPCARKPSCYAQMLQLTYQAIKSVRPDVTVVGGALFSADLSWFSQLFQDGALHSMDAVSDHPYTAFTITSPELAQIRQQMAKLEALIRQFNGGQSKPMWITELGWPTSFLHVNERVQADYLVRSAVLTLAAGVQKFFWYDLLNDGTDFSKAEQNFGLLYRPDATGRYTPKPSYMAYAVLARQLSNQHFIGSGSEGWGIYDEYFTNNVHVLWSILGSRDITVSTTTPVTVTSMTGSVRTYTPSHGQVNLKLSGDPVYLQGSVTNIAWDPL